MLLSTRASVDGETETRRGQERVLSSSPGGTLLKKAKGNHARPCVTILLEKQKKMLEIVSRLSKNDQKNCKKLPSCLKQHMVLKHTSSPYG